MRKIFLVICLSIVLGLGCIPCQGKVHQDAVSTPRLIVPVQIQPLLEWLNANPKHVQKAFDEYDLFYHKPGADYGVCAHKFGEMGDISIPNANINYTLDLPVLLKNRKNLYVDFNDQSGHYIIRINQTGKAKYLYCLDTGFTSYDISPNESEIAFSKMSNKMNQIYRYLFKEQQMIQLSVDSVGGMFPRYSDDGKQIAYCAQRKLRIKDLATSNEEIIVGDTMLKEFPKWSPDGNWIVYQASVDGNKPYDIYKVNVQTKELFQLTDGPELDANPCFDKSGKQIIYISGLRSRTIEFHPKLWKMDADGNNKVWDPCSPSDVFSPCW